MQCQPFLPASFLLLMICVCAAHAGAPGLVSVDELARQLDEPQPVIVHVGPDRADYLHGHIPGARFADWRRLGRTRGDVPMQLPAIDELVQIMRDLGIRPQDQVVLYDDAGGLQAARLFMALDVLGMGASTAMLDGQLSAWRSADKPLTTDPEEVIPSDFVPLAYRQQIIIEHWSMRNRVWLQQNAPEDAEAPDVDGLLIIDARPEAEFTGREPGTDIERPGHIPGATHLFWRDQLSENDDHRLRPREQLLAMYEQLGLRAGMTPVVYCRTGNQSAMNYFVLRYLGFSPRSYDGSFIEWSRDSTAPVANP